MGRPCPFCKKGIMTIRGKKYNRKWRCSQCGNWIFTSPGGHSRGSMLGTQPAEVHPDPKVEEASQRLHEGLPQPIPIKKREKKEEIPVIEEEKHKMTEEEKVMREESLRFQRKQESIRRMLKELGKGKYSPFKGKEIFIEGEKYIVE